MITSIDKVPSYDPEEDESWRNIVASALCYDPWFQRICINEMLEPGQHFDKYAILNPLWVIGLYLPESWIRKTVTQVKRPTLKFIA